MSTLETNLVQPSTGTTLTLGASGDTIDIPSGVTLDTTGATITGALTNTPNFRAHRGSTQTISSGTTTKIQFDTEQWDTDGKYDNSSNYRFTPGSIGYYYLYSTLYVSTLGDQNFANLVIRENGSTDLTYTRFLGSGTGGRSMLTETTVYVDNVADYFEVYLYNSVGCDVTSSSGAYSYFGGYKLIGV